MAPSPKAAGGVPRPPVVRLAPRDELAAAARVAPLLRAARDLARWVTARQDGRSGREEPSLPDAAAAELDLSSEELEAAWQVAAGTGMLGTAGSGRPADILSGGDPDAVLALWDNALGVTLRAPELDGLVTALYTVDGPVRIDALFEAYETARRAAPPGDSPPGPPPGPAEGEGVETADVARLSAALETLADLGVVDLGSDEEAGVLTVVLSRL
ncbi:MAG TPA: hypothetical protein VGS62_11455, partial [Streptosporangiaceae bacterium]|nr:hypothetical protein [Streptosporangiaceae bacterium]